jgi:cobalt-zinc-cadmium resistance protein CzcA
VVVSANVRGRDIGSFVGGERRIAEVKVAGYWTAGAASSSSCSRPPSACRSWCRWRCCWCSLLFMMFNNLKDGLLVFTGIPFALTGGAGAVAAGYSAVDLGRRGLHRAVRGGGAQRAGDDRLHPQPARGGRGLGAAIDEGALTRLRPVLMTALVASLGFIPMALATGTGAEVQRPLATVVIGGILSSTALTLLVLPALYRWMHRRDEEAAEA